jgi:hypothetical protein
MPNGKIVTITQLLQAAAAILLVGRLLHFQLAGTMRAMAAWQILTVALSLGTSALYDYPRIYGYLFSVTLPLNAVLMVLAVTELFGLVFSRYPGIRTMGRRAVYVSVVTSALIAYAVLAILGQYGGKKGISYYAMLAERSTVFTLALFILIILFFLSRYPMQMPRNFSVSCSLFCTVFLSEAFVLFFETTNPRGAFVPDLDLAQVVVSIVCLISWAFLLKPESVAEPEVRRPNGESEEQLLAQLESLNRLLSRAARH